MIQATIPDKYTHMSAGSRIIDQGGKSHSTPCRHASSNESRNDPKSENLWSPMTIAGSLGMSILLIDRGQLYFKINHPPIL